jgi:outer membrane lipoprotein SlyB
MNAKYRLIPIAGAAALAMTLGACSDVPLYGQEGGYPPNTVGTATYPSTSTYSTAPVYSSAPVASVEYGRVTDVRLVSGAPVAAASPNRAAVGTAIGAVVGGLIGNQIGGGVGRGAATVLGAVGGGIAGNRIANNTAPNAYATTNPVYQVTVQTDQGAMRTYDVSATGDLRVGDRVRIENGVIYLG